MTERRRREAASRLLRGCGSMVLRAGNARYSVRYRVVVFVVAGVRRRLLHRELMALRYLVVYVGAIAVLLRFVVMRLNLNKWEREESAENKGSSGSVIAGRAFRGGRLRAVRGALLGGERKWRVVTRFVSVSVQGLETRWVEAPKREGMLDESGRRKELGQFRYTEGRPYVRVAGLVRRVSRLAAVVLTLDELSSKKLKRQRVSEQLSRSATLA